MDATLAPFFSLSRLKQRARVASITLKTKFFSGFKNRARVASITTAVVPTTAADIELQMGPNLINNLCLLLLCI